MVLIQNKENHGFSGGNNTGIKYGLDILKSKYILLLNNDTIVEKDFLTKLVEVMENNEEIGSVQSLLLRPGGEVIDSLGQELLCWGAKDKGIGEKYKGTIKNTEIFGACAASSLYRSNDLKKIGLFDESFFIIFEDVDLSWKLRLTGKSSLLVSKSTVYHKRGISGEENSNITKEYHTMKNWLIIALRYYPLKPNKKIFISWIFITFILSFKNNSLYEFLEVFVKNSFNRLTRKESKTLRIIQKKWIGKC